MQIISKTEFERLISEYPNGGIIFSEYNDRKGIIDSTKVTDGKFGATEIFPIDGEEFSWDWNIREYSDNDQFVIWDYVDILYVIQTLTKFLPLSKELSWDGPVSI